MYSLACSGLNSRRKKGEYEGQKSAARSHIVYIGAITHMRSSCLSQDLNSTRMCGITMDSVAVSFEIAWVISSTEDETSTIFLAISNWFAARCWMLFSAAYAAKAIFCSKIDSNMYKVKFHLVTTSCLSLCLGSCRFSWICANL